MRCSADCGVTIAVGRDQVLQRLPEVAALVAGTPQESEAADVEYFLDRPTLARLFPHLLLLGCGHPPDAKLLGAVLVFTSIDLRGRKVFSSLNNLGRRTVFGPPQHRLEIAAIAAQTLLERGADFATIHIAMGLPRRDGVAAHEAWLQECRRVSDLLPGIPGVESDWALHSGSAQFDMPLGADYGSTLESLGKRTRRNLRYYGRVCVRKLGCQFVPRVAITLADFMELNRASHFAAAPEVVAWRYGSLTRFPQVFCAGLQNSHGQWLSLLGGRRTNGFVEVDWQMNRTGYERFSLSTALRGFLLEHEARIGSTSFSFEGGNKHSMSESMRTRAVYSLAVRRRRACFPEQQPPLADYFLGVEPEFLSQPVWNWNPCSPRDVAPQQSGVTPC